MSPYLAHRLLRASGKNITKYGPLYIHFKEKCLRKYDTNFNKSYYAPMEQFDWKRITVHPVNYVVVVAERRQK